MNTPEMKTPMEEALDHARWMLVNRNHWHPEYVETWIEDVQCDNDMLRTEGYSEDALVQRVFDALSAEADEIEEV